MVKITGSILVIDKDLKDIKLLKQTLVSLCSNFLAFTDPLEALKVSKNENIDLLILDGSLPHIDMLCFIEQFKKQHPAAIILYACKSDNKEKELKKYNLCTCIHVEKPYDKKSIKEQVKSALKIKKTQDELLKEKEQLTYICNFSNNELILTDLNFNIISRNNTILPPDLSKVTNFIDILEINKQEEIIEQVKFFAKSKEKQLSFRLILLNGKYTKTNITKITKNDTHCGYLVVMNDFTEEIERAKQRECFIEMLTHDLKTPARAEGRALELLYEGTLGTLNKDQKDMVKEILNSSRYMIRMTDNVLTSLRFETEALKLNKKMNSIKHTIEHCINEIKYMLEEAHQTIKISSDTDEDTFLYDEETIKLVIINLLTNSCEYSPKNSTIYISVKKLFDNILISVRDEGLGIAEEKINLIFKEQTSLTKRFKKVGTGLGLFVCKKIMETHNGSIELNKNCKIGTEFILSLPYKKIKSKEMCEAK